MELLLFVHPSSSLFLSVCLSVPIFPCRSELNKRGWEKGRELKGGDEERESGWAHLGFFFFFLLLFVLDLLLSMGLGLFFIFLFSCPLFFS